VSFIRKNWVWLLLALVAVYWFSKKQSDSQATAAGTGWLGRVNNWFGRASSGAQTITNDFNSISSTIQNVWKSYV
jgi:hypothetical protein